MSLSGLVVPFGRPRGEVVLFMVLFVSFFPSPASSVTVGEFRKAPKGFGYAVTVAQLGI